MTEGEGPNNSGTVFVTVQECENCGNGWEEEHHAGDEVEERNAAGVYVEACGRSGCRSSVRKEETCGRCRFLQCPVCELQEHVKVENRAPLGDGDD